MQMNAALPSCSQETPISSLVVAAQSGDREALGALLTRCRQAVYAVALRRLGDEGEAQELVQEVFVQAMLKLSQLREPQAFPGWILAIAQRMAINRAVRRRPLPLAEPDVIAAAFVDHQTPLRRALARERKRQVQAGLKRLRSMDRDTLTAFYVNGRSLVQMSDDFDSPVGTIKRRLHVARKRLRKQLEGVAV
jgi:RNA polymerase sigma-70 factor (ECF subfamily)